MEFPTYQTLVLGVGNTLLFDDGFGVHVVERLVQQYVLPKEVHALDGGTLGMDLLYYLEGVENLLIVDAVEARQKPGALLRLSDLDEPNRTVSQWRIIRMFSICSKSRAPSSNDLFAGRPIWTFSTPQP